MFQNDPPILIHKWVSILEIPTLEHFQFNFQLDMHMFISNLAHVFTQQTGPFLIFQRTGSLHTQKYFEMQAFPTDAFFIIWWKIPRKFPFLWALTININNVFMIVLCAKTKHFWMVFVIIDAAIVFKISS